MLMVCQFV